MKIRRKIVPIVILLLFALNFSIYALASSLMQSHFLGIEQEQMTLTVKFVLGVIDQELDELEAIAQSYADRPAKDQASLNAYFNLATLTHFKLDLFVVSDPQGKIMFQRSLDLPAKRFKNPPKLPINLAQNQRGIAIVNNQPLIISSVPILSSPTTGSKGGWLLVGRYLNQGEVAEIANLTQLKVEPRLVVDTPVTGEIIRIDVLDQDQIVGQTLLADVSTRPPLVVTAIKDRPIYQKLQKFLGLWLIALVLVGLGLSLLVLVFIERKLVARIEKTYQIINKIIADNNLSLRLPVTGRDELDQMAGAFNQMIAQILENQEQLATKYQQLTSSEARFRNLFETIPTIAVQVYDREHRVIFWNQASTNLYGYTAEEAMGQRLKALLIPPARRSLVTNVIDEWIRVADQTQVSIIDMRQDCQICGETELLHKNGKLITVYANYLLCRNVDNEIEIYCIDVDLCRQKTLEQQRQQAEQKLEKVAKNLPGMIFRQLIRTDGTDKLLYVSDYCRQIFAVEPELALHNSQLLWECIHPNDREQVHLHFAQASQSLTSHCYEYRITNAHSIRHLACYCMAEIQTNGDVIRDGVVLDISDRKRLENDLAQNLQYFKELLNNVPAVVYQYCLRQDGSEAFLYMSENATEILGFSAGDCCADTNCVWQGMRPKDLSDLRQAIQESREYQTRLCEVYRYRMPDGQLKWLENKSSPHLQVNGDVIWDGVIIDISDRKAIELELLRSRDLQEAIYDNSTDAILLVDGVVNQIILDCNQRAVSMFGRQSKNELLGEEANCLQKCPLSPAALAEIKKQINHQGYWQAELEFLTADEQSFWGAIAAKPITIAHESFTLVRIADISEQKLAELKLQESDQRLRLTLEINQVGTWDWNIQTNLVTWSAQTYRLLGIPLHQSVTAESFFSILHPEDYQMVQSNLDKSIQQGSTYDAQFRVMLASGKTRWLQARGECYYEADSAVRMLGILIDISDRHEVERLKDEFIGIVSHEIRTPLTAIQGSMAILASGVYDNRPEKARRMLNIALTNGDRLLRLVNDILDLERLDAGRGQLEMQPCQVNLIVAEVADAMMNIALNQKIELVWSAIEQEVIAARDALVRTLTNLINNAIKFSPPESRIIIKVEEISENSSPYLLFSVQDFGRGIPPEHLETIFMRFSQVDGSDARDKGGTGLGLAICKSIVEQHQGRIWVESQLGHGSTFFFTIPLLVPSELTRH